LLKHGDLRGSERWDNLAKAWVKADVWQEIQWLREEMAFQRKANQGELCCPNIISDGMKTVQSQVSGKYYDSKSAIRREYKETGMIEVGNDVPKTRFVHGNRPWKDPYKQAASIDKTVGTAQAAVKTMSDETIKRRQWERAERAHKVAI
jgi:hypothetical protein